MVDFFQKTPTAGCHQIVRETEAGGSSGLWELVTGLHEGDVLILCQSSHAGPERDFLNLLAGVGRKRAHFVSIAEDFDTLRDTVLHYTEAVR